MFALSGWKQAKAKAGAAPSREERKKSALTWAVVAAVAAALALRKLLPVVMEKLPFGKGEGIPIHTYGVLVGGGFIAAVTLCGWLARREWPGEEGEHKREQIFDLAFWVFIGGMVGSRVLFVIINWKDYAQSPGKILSLEGGLVFYGGLIGAALTSLVYARVHRIDFLRLADIAMPAVSLGQCLGRLGCFAAGCCWGRIAPAGTAATVQFPGKGVQNLFGGPGGTASLAYQSMAEDSRFAVEQSGEVLHQMAPGASRISEWVAQHGHTFPVYATQLYESIGQLVLFAALLTMRRFRLFHGQVFGLWLMCYAVLRSTVELFRGDVERGTLHGLLNYLGMGALAEKFPLEAWYNISISQFISICMFTLGAAVLYRKARQRKESGRAELTLASA
ncbi:MAG: prolipoprotein diacylglyceryl transferase [Myxococcales bacterium]|nr:prolipoprotein diacylglyceryl transferase [Myxococcales bacterium]